MRKKETKRLTATEEKMIEKELRDKGYSQLMPSRGGHGKQLDRMEKCLNHLHRMLKYLVIKNKIDKIDDTLKELRNDDSATTADVVQNIANKDIFTKKLPDISDIVEGK